MIKIFNAKVKFSFLGKEEGKGLCFQLGFLCANNTTFVTDILPVNDMSIINKIVSILEIKSWEEINRKFARIKVQDGKIIELGNILEERWIKL